jgi:L-histidine Nalpha-methyltransferase
MSLPASQTADRESLHRTSEFLHDVIRGLEQPQKTLPCKHFYDRRGAELFEQICTLDEYYPTRAEIEIMQSAAPDMAALVGPRAAVIEPGSGAGIKARLLLEALEDPVAYIPIDISREQLHQTAAQIDREFPALAVHAIHADFAAGVTLPPLPARRRLIYFPGSTIGNFGRPEAISFLKRLAALGGPGAALLIGVDLKKDRATLETAYNDAAGITAAFNLNLLKRINRELGADFNLRNFRHRAFYNQAAGRIEMHILSLLDQRITVAGHAFDFREGETIHTENSHKYAPAEFRNLLGSAGWHAEHTWLNPAGQFGVFFASR